MLLFKDLTDGEGSVSSNEKDFDTKKTEEPARKRVKREKVLDNDYIHENSMDILDKFDTSPEGSEHENGSGDPEYVPNGKEKINHVTIAFIAFGITVHNHSMY